MDGLTKLFRTTVAVIVFLVIASLLNRGASSAGTKSAVPIRGYYVTTRIARWEPSPNRLYFRVPHGLYMGNTRTLESQICRYVRGNPGGLWRWPSRLPRVDQNRFDCTEHSLLSSQLRRLDDQHLWARKLRYSRHARHWCNEH